GCRHDWLSLREEELSPPARVALPAPAVAGATRSAHASMTVEVFRSPAGPTLLRAALAGGSVLLSHYEDCRYTVFETPPGGLGMALTSAMACVPAARS